MVAAFLVMRVLGVHTDLDSSHPFTELTASRRAARRRRVLPRQRVHGGVAVALYHERVPILRYFRNDFFFVVVTAGVLLLLAPIVIAAAAYSPLLVPLFLAPMLAIYNTVWQGARSEHAARHDSLTEPAQPTGLPRDGHGRDRRRLRARPRSC